MVLEDLQISDAINGVDLRAPFDEDEQTAPRVRMARVVISGIAERGLEIADMDVDAAQVVALDAGSVAVQFSQRTPRNTRVNLRGLWARSNGQAPVRIGPNVQLPITNTLVVDGTDWIVDSTQGTYSQYGLLMRDGVELNLSRAVIVGGPEAGVQVDCGDGVMTDLVVLGGANYGLAMQPQFGIRLERSQVFGAPATGIEIARVHSICDFGVFEASDVVLEGCETCDRGIRLARSAQAKLRRVRASSFVVALDVEDLATARLDDSALSDSEVGLQIPEAHDLDPVVRGVQFSRNTKDLVRTR